MRVAVLTTSFQPRRLTLNWLTYVKPVLFLLALLYYIISVFGLYRQ